MDLTHESRTRAKHDLGGHLPSGVKARKGGDWVPYPSIFSQVYMDWEPCLHQWMLFFFNF